jgi:hypothetical protein
MIHTSFYRPNIIPNHGDTDRSEIDRLQDLTASVTLNRTKIKEIGRDGIVGWKTSIPTVTVNLRQLEHGSIEFWNQLANKAVANTVINLNDFKTAQSDILGYKTDDNGTFLGTVQYPKLRTSGFNINVGDPEANSELTFNMVGEDEYFWQNDNKYVIFLNDDTCIGINHTIVIGTAPYANYPDPVLDPDTSATYIQKIIRLRAGIDTLLIEGTDYTYDNGTTTITFTPGSTVAGDKYKVFYTAGVYITGEEPFVNNDADMSCLPAENLSIYMATNEYLYRLQSVAIDVTFERQDIKEIGNSEVVASGIKTKTVTVTLGRILETFTIEEILLGKTGLDWGKINPRNFADDITLIVKCYSDRTKTQFKMGYKITNLSPTSLNAGVPLDDYATRQAVMEAEEMIITNDENEL